MSFVGKTALVTGGGSGIGRATALLLAERGAQVVVSGRRLESLEETVALVQDKGGQARAVAGDIASEKDVAAMVGTAVEAFGSLDVAVNNAGDEGVLAEITALSYEDFTATLALNVTGTFLCLKYEMAAMQERGGSILNVSSVNATRSEPTAAAYCASKAALESLTKTAALEGAPSGIRVNALRAGFFVTPMHLRGLEPHGGETPENLAEFAALVPLGRRGDPVEAARSIVWLCSDEASYVSGSMLTVDGGLTAN
jgi:NAD(P)-dependent dehydrogenase (short-subunit alcohol dehydrogenase family)